MTLTELLAAVQASGRSLSSNGTTITLGPGKQLPKAVLEGLRSHKPELLELLSQGEAQPAANDTPEGELVQAALKAFPGARMRWLSDVEHDAIGFRSEKSGVSRLTPRAQRVQMFTAHPLPPACEDEQ